MSKWIVRAYRAILNDIGTGFAWVIITLLGVIIPLVMIIGTALLSLAWIWGLARGDIGLRCLPLGLLIPVAVLVIRWYVVLMDRIF